MSFLRTPALATGLWLLAATVAWATTQEGVEIRHAPIECWPTDQFLFVESTFQPPTDVQTAKFYFRSSTHPDFYFVEMTLNRQGTGRAIVPKADTSTVGVVYYIEIVTRGFSAYRSAEITTSVSSGSECLRREPETAFYTGANPDIALGSTRAGVPPLAPGFQADGISRFISVQGFAGEAGGGGGISGKTIGALVGAGGGAGLAFALAGGSSESTTTGLGGNTTVTTTAGTTTTAIGGATSTTTTASGGGGSSTTTTTGGASTTTGGPSSTTTTGGPSTTTTTGGPSTTTTIGTTTSASTTSATTTKPPTTTIASTTSATTTKPPTTTIPTADLQVTKSGAGSVTAGSNLIYSITVTNNGGPDTATGIFLDDSYSISPSSTIVFISVDNTNCGIAGINRIACNLGSLAKNASVTVHLTVRPTAPGSMTNSASADSVEFDPNSSNSSDTVATNVTPVRAPDSQELRLSYRSLLGIEPLDGRVRGRIVVNGSQSQETTNSGEFVYTATVHDGRNVVEAYASETSPGGSWRFDFHGSKDFVPGSLQVDSGQLLGQDGYQATFSLAPGSPAIRFTFEVGQGRRPRLLRDADSAVPASGALTEDDPRASPDLSEK